MDRPAVHLSYAQSLDGRIATKIGDARYISGPETLELAHRIRSENQAILVGIGTALADDPELSCRLPDGCPEQPLRVVLDGDARLPLDSRLVSSARRQGLLVLHRDGGGSAGMRDRVDALVGRGARCLGVGAGPDGRLDLGQALRTLAGEGVESLFVEGGKAVLTAFVREGLFDLLTVVVAPLLIGQGVEALGDLGVERLVQARRLETVWLRQIGGDIAWRLRPVAG